VDKGIRENFDKKLIDDYYSRKLDNDQYIIDQRQVEIIKEK